jgi:metal-responsive CopG/Arc/MetJ family transcriptional regulator
MLKEIIRTVITGVNKISESRGYNKYIKKYPIEKMFLYLLWHQYSSINNGRAFTLYLKSTIGEITDTISQSELSKKLGYRLDVQLFKEMYHLLLNQAKNLKKKDRKRIREMTRIIDSTALTATDSMKYAKHRRNKNGFKMHTVIDGHYILESFELKNGNSSDRKSLKWAIKEGYVHIFDKGYNDFSQFKWISEQNAFFVTRAFKNIVYKTVRNKKVGESQKQYGIESDKIIEVFVNRQTNATFMMRMVTFSFIDSRGSKQRFSLLTNLLGYRSDEVARLYRERWNIEVVFRWLKTFLNIKQWMSRSISGVLIQLYTALCAYLIAFISKRNDPDKFRIMKDCIYEFISEFIKILQLYEPGSNIGDFIYESS